MRQDERQGAGATLGNFVAATSWADVAAQSHGAKRSILNFFATAIGSACDPAVSAALRAPARFSGSATPVIVGQSERLDALGAAFINAISANLLDFDDTTWTRSFIRHHSAAGSHQKLPQQTDGEATCQK